MDNQYNELILNEFFHPASDDEEIQLIDLLWRTFPGTELLYKSLLLKILYSENPDAIILARKKIKKLNQQYKTENVAFSKSFLTGIHARIEEKIWEDSESFVEVIELLEITSHNNSLRIVFSQIFGNMLDPDDKNRPTFLQFNSVLENAAKLNLTDKRKEIIALLQEYFFFSNSKFTQNNMIRLMDSIASEETYYQLLALYEEDLIFHAGYRLLYPYYQKEEVKALVRKQFEKNNIPEEIIEWANLSLDPIAFYSMKKDHIDSYLSMGHHNLDRLAYFDVCDNPDVHDLLAEYPTRACFPMWFHTVQRTGSFEAIPHIGDFLFYKNSLEDLIRISQKELNKLAADALLFFDETFDSEEARHLLKIVFNFSEDLNAKHEAYKALIQSSHITEEDKNKLVLIPKEK